MKKYNENVLDEMQDQKLLKLEEYGFWILFWALAFSIVVQLVLGAPLRQVLGELIIAAIGGIWISFTTLKNGIWTRKSTPTRKANALTAIIPAALIGTLNIIKMIQNHKTDTGSILTAAAVIVITYVACFAVLEVFRASYNKQRDKLDDIEEK